ncbi:MAG TPA: hypothetical protein VFZ09_08885 [Archangium sp.]|uniref:hypothetical protein n=1 Tax=Archangium sp. TaxID=1872627 RepID=UPI002E3797B6|nr:hypothetical protein [Archangium sp.]HEX5746347.1 hypothetical protein [Archangium sp.]
MMRNWMKWLPACLALVAWPAQAEPPAKSPAQELSAGLTNISYISSYSRTPQIFAAEVAYHRALGAEGFLSRVWVGGGLRGHLPTVLRPMPLEVYVQARVTARFGIWEAAAGPEFGVSGMATLYPLLGDNDVGQIEQKLLGPAYFGFGAAPLRFHLGPVLLSALEFNFGSSLPPLGSATSVRLTLIRLGVNL